MLCVGTIYRTPLNTAGLIGMGVELDLMVVPKMCAAEENAVSRSFTVSYFLGSVGTSLWCTCSCNYL